MSNLPVIAGTYSYSASSILLDAAWIRAGASTFAAIDASHKLAFFTGSPMALHQQDGR